MVQNTKEILIWVGLVAAVSAGAAGLLGSGVISSAQSESLEITGTMKKTSNTDVLVTVSVKNSGTSQIEYLSVTINDFTAPPASIIVPPIRVVPIDGFVLPGYRNTTGGNVIPVCTTCLFTTTDPPQDSYDLTFAFHATDNNDKLNAGQVISYSNTIQHSSQTVSVGDSFTITAAGLINGNLIVNTAVVTVTGF